MGRLGAIGTLVWDTIIPPEPGGETTRGWGGIAYALAAFEACGPRGWSLLPIVKVGRDLRERADAFLGRLGSVSSLEGVRTVSEPTNRVELRYRDRVRRTEVLSGGVPGWKWDELRPLARSCDAVYLNFIAGWEVDLPAATELSGSAGVPIYCDLHSLLLDVAPDGTRVPRAPEGWEVWVDLFDFLQMNGEELDVLADASGRDPAGFARELLGGRPRAVFVTRGERGAEWMAAPGEPGGPAEERREEAAPRAGSAPLDDPVAGGDPTGCGDVWGMACFTALLDGAEVPDAAARANRLARRNARHRGTDGLAEALAEELRSAGAGSAG